MNFQKILKYIPLFSCAAASAAAEPSAPKEAEINDVIAFGGQNYLVVHKFGSFPQYEEFQRNAQIMRTSYAAMEKLSAQIKSERDASAASALSAQLKRLQSVFSENEKAMRAGYNYVSSRQYAAMFYKSNICVPITGEEASSLKLGDGSKIEAGSIIKDSAGNLYARRSSIVGVKENMEFQRAMYLALSRRMELKKLRDSLAETTDAEKTAQIAADIANLEKSLKGDEKTLRENYGLEIGKKYLVEIEKSFLVMQISPEELEKINEEKAKLNKN